MKASIVTGFAKRVAALAAISACAVIVVQATGFAQTAQTASLDLLRRAVDPNPTLNSYTGSAHLSATLHVLLPVHKEYDGTVYYLRPRRKIEFANVTGALSKFKDLATSTPTYEQATELYTIAPLTDNGNVSAYIAVPKKKGGRVKSLTITVDDKSALVSQAVWAYTNGGTLRVNQSYMDVGTYHLPSKADISARFPSYSVDGTLTFSNYNPNAAVSPSEVATPSPSP
jgi:hypothetical protein